MKNSLHQKVSIACISLHWLRWGDALKCVKRERYEEGFQKSPMSPVGTGPLLVPGAVQHGLMATPSLHSSVTLHHLVHCHHEHSSSVCLHPAFQITTSATTNRHYLPGLSRYPDILLGGL